MLWLLLYQVLWINLPQGCGTWAISHPKSDGSAQRSSWPQMDNCVLLPIRHAGECIGDCITNAESRRNKMLHFILARASRSPEHASLVTRYPASRSCFCCQGEPEKYCRLQQTRVEKAWNLNLIDLFFMYYRPSARLKRVFMSGVAKKKINFVASRRAL